jgi:hypothetical protein
MRCSCSVEDGPIRDIYHSDGTITHLLSGFLHLLSAQGLLPGSLKHVFHSLTQRRKRLDFRLVAATLHAGPPVPMASIAQETDAHAGAAEKCVVDYIQPTLFPGE